MASQSDSDQRVFAFTGNKTWREPWFEGINAQFAVWRWFLHRPWELTKRDGEGRPPEEGRRRLHRFRK